MTIDIKDVKNFIRPEECQYSAKKLLLAIFNIFNVIKYYM